VEGDPLEIGVLDVLRQEVEQGEDLRTREHRGEFGQHPLAAPEGRAPVMDDGDPAAGR
jgi:hypothetical protein